MLKIDYLGHSEILINITNSTGEKVKILSDAWLSDYSVADLMQRNPILAIDYSKFDVDAIFISHSHMDHLDPYFLYNFFKNSQKKPIILLPETLVYLKDILEENLQTEIKILKNKETIDFKGINIQGIIFPDWMNTNEADVMTLAVWNDKEIVYTEVDIVPPDSEDGIAYIYQLFTQKDFTTRLYLSTRNELEGNLTIIDLDKKQRKDFLLDYKEKRIAEMYQHFNNVFALEENGIDANIYSLPGFVKAFVGQGIIFPVKDFGCDALKLQIMSLQENVELETEVAGDFGLVYPIYSLHKVGDLIKDYKENNLGKAKDCAYEWLGSHIFDKGDLQAVKAIDFVNGVYFKTQPDLNCDCKRKVLDMSVKKYDNLDINLAKEKILNYLNTRFLAYQMGRLDANLKNLALENNGKYVIQLKTYDFENNKKNIVGYMRWDLGSNGFYFSENEETYQETYFIEDLLNFFDGKIELYSNFWSYLEPGTNIFLWECLGANFINNDTVKKKFKYHFDLARKGKSTEEVVKEMEIYERVVA